MDKITIIGVITSPFVSFVLFPLILAALFVVFYKESPKKKKK